MENKNYTHSVNILERGSLSISGVKKINNFDEKEFYIESVMGSILIKGESLELIKMDTFQGDISIKGKIDSILYFDEKNKKIKMDSIVSRLFK